MRLHAADSAFLADDTIFNWMLSPHRVIRLRLQRHSSLGRDDAYPQEIVESAELDSAGLVTEFFKITVRDLADLSSRRADVDGALHRLHAPMMISFNRRTTRRRSRSSHCRRCRTSQSLLFFRNQHSDRAGFRPTTLLRKDPRPDVHRRGDLAYGYEQSTRQNMNMNCRLVQQGKGCIWKEHRHPGGAHRSTGIYDVDGYAGCLNPIPNDVDLQLVWLSAANTRAPAGRHGACGILEHL
ncbi:MAG: hypothetical protein ACLRSW_05455 [Christensenellaceae bacterium]